MQFVGYTSIFLVKIFQNVINKIQRNSSVYIMTKTLCVRVFVFLWSASLCISSPFCSPCSIWVGGHHCHFFSPACNLHHSDHHKSLVTAQLDNSVTFQCVFLEYNLSCSTYFRSHLSAHVIPFVGAFNSCCLHEIFSKVINFIKRVNRKIFIFKYLID